MDSASDAGSALGAVLAEIGEIAKEMFSSITVCPMLTLIERQRAAEAKKQKAAS